MALQTVFVSPRNANALEFRWSIRVKYTGLENDLQRYTQESLNEKLKTHFYCFAFDID